MAVTANTVAVRPLRLFYPSMHFILVAIVVAGFAPNLLQRAPDAAPMAPLVMLHGLVMAVWMLLALAQSSLPSLGLTQIHRRLGLAAAVLGAVVIVFGLVTTVYGVRDGWNPSRGAFGGPEQFAAVPFRDIATFAALFVPAFLLRRRPETHKRLMLLATMTLSAAALSRIVVPGVPPFLVVAGGLLLLLGACLVRDLIIRRNVHPATGWGSALILGSVLLAKPIGDSSAWIGLVKAVAG